MNLKNPPRISSLAFDCSISSVMLNSSCCYCSISAMIFADSKLASKISDNVMMSDAFIILRSSISAWNCESIGL